MKKFLIVLFFILCFNIFSAEIIGIGYSSSEQISIYYSIENLNYKLKKDIEYKISNNLLLFENIEKEKLSYYLENLPLTNIEIITKKIENIYETKAIFNYEKQKDYYLSKLFQFNKDIESNITNFLKLISSNDKNRILLKILALVRNFRRYYILAKYLDNNNIPQLYTDEIKLENDILNNYQANSLVYGIKLISEILYNTNNIFCYPVTNYISETITDFSNIIYDNLIKSIKKVDFPDYATYILKGKYQLIDNGINGIIVSFDLFDKYNNIERSILIKFSENCYKNIKIKNNTLFYENIIKDKIKSNDIDFQITTIKGKNNLLFKNNEIVKIYIRSNVSGFVFLIKHIFKKDDSYSSILKLNNEDFIYYITENDINKWILIAEYKVYEPFGMENIQAIYCNENICSYLPSYSYDDFLDEYFMFNEPENGIKIIRDIIKNLSKNKKYFFSEDYLILTTFQ